MTGGLMQLVAYGAQDIYLTGNPMITYFKVVYRRHTNFAMESIEQTFSGSVGFGQKVSCLISRNGDLVSGVTLEAVLPQITLTGATTTVAATVLRWTDDVGHHLIDEVSVEIGGQLIDKHWGDWLEIWAELSVPAGKMRGYRQMIGQDPADSLGRPTGLQKDKAQAAAEADTTTNAGRGTNGLAGTGRKIFVPLQFWFCRNIGLALPLIALQYHEVKINVSFRSLTSLLVAQLTTGSASGTLSASLWVDYVYLDTDERRRFAQVSHEYLIEQLQRQTHSSSTANTSVRLDFNHPVKELIWVSQLDVAVAAYTSQWSNYSNMYYAQVAAGISIDTFPFVGVTTGLDNTGNTGAFGSTAVANFTTANGSATIANTSTAAIGKESILHQALAYSMKCFLTRTGEPASGPLSTAKLVLNGHDRFATRDGEYFNWTQPDRHHSNIPESQGIYVYSFALKPEEHQPSGTCNFSRIDNAKLDLVFINQYGVTPDNATALAAGARTTRVYAVNYNVLRIMSGMGGLAYSN